MLDLIGYSTIPEDTKVAQSLLEKGIAWAFTVPAWLSLLIAAAVTAWLIWWAWRPVPTPITSTSTSAEADLIKQQRLAAKEKRVAASAAARPLTPHAVEQKVKVIDQAIELMRGAPMFLERLSVMFRDPWQTSGKSFPPTRKKRNTNMNAIVSKWGNSLALRIPNGIARALDLREQTSVLFDVRDGALIVRPVEKKKFDLDTLLSGITAENIHAETSTGPSVGNESHAGAISAIASANAPFIYIDGVPNYGVNHGVMNLTLEALRFQPGGQAGVLVDRVIVAHLRMSLPAAESLRAAIDAAFALVHPKPEQVN